MVRDVIQKRDAFHRLINDAVLLTHTMNIMKRICEQQVSFKENRNHKETCTYNHKNTMKKKDFVNLTLMDILEDKQGETE